MSKFVDDISVVESSVRYQLLSKEATPPLRNSGINLELASEDVGIDLFVSGVEDVINDPDGIPVRCKIRTGVVLAAPVGFSIMLAPRSSLAKSGWYIANTIGIIDNGYRGELLVLLARLPDWGVQRKATFYKARGINNEVINIASMEETSRKEPSLPETGHRVAQAIVVKDYILPLIESAGDLSSEETGRGAKGFGSSGK